jgi:drug/metabolite transporter (DMT)-like permease
MSRSMRAHVLLLAVVCVWGATFALTKAALRDISPLLFNLVRMVLAFACLTVFYRRWLKSIGRRALASGAVVGLCLAMGYQFQTAGLARTTPSKSAFITGLVVVLVPLLAAIPVIRPSNVHKPHWNAWVGALLAFVGIVLLTTPAGTLMNFREINLGDLLTLGCALGFALHVIALAHTSPRVRFEQLAPLQVGFCALFMSVSTPLLEHSHVRWTGWVFAAIIIDGVFATAVAFSIQSWAQQFLPATHTALILAMEPVFAWLTSFLLLGERLGARAGAGAGLILAGIALTELIQTGVQPTAHEGVPL